MEEAGLGAGRREAGAASGYPFTRETLPHHTLCVPSSRTLVA